MFPGIQNLLPVLEKKNFDKTFLTGTQFQMSLQWLDPYPFRSCIFYQVLQYRARTGHQWYSPYTILDIHCRQFPE